MRRRLCSNCKQKTFTWMRWQGKTYCLKCFGKQVDESKKEGELNMTIDEALKRTKTDKIEEVKKILEVNTVSWYRDDKIAWIEVTAKQICQLFESAPRKEMLKAQAEISFKTGIKEVAEWILDHSIITHGKEPSTFTFDMAKWQAKLEEWGINSL